MWFENHSWEYLENKYLNNGKRGIDVVKEELKLFLLEAMSRDEFAEDRRSPTTRIGLRIKLWRPSTIQRWHTCKCIVRGQEAMMGVGLESRGFCRR